MGINDKKLYETKSAILFIVFNRPETTKQVFDKIRDARPTRLYIAADGPRSFNNSDRELCIKTRAIVNEIDWKCEVKTLFRDENLGCKDALSSAISWFFEHEEEGIILEDDCLPSNDFFGFCDTLLDRYRLDTRIWYITGSNLRTGQWGDGDYYFSNLPCIWGWASWKRVWRHYDKELTTYKPEEIREPLENIFEDAFIVDGWIKYFEDVKNGVINSWDYQITFTHFFNHALSITPNNNMITNIGYGEGALNTFDVNSRFSNIPLEPLRGIKEPTYILPQKKADLITITYDFKDLIEQKRKNNLLRRKFKRWVKGLFRHPAVNNEPSQ